MASNKQLSRNGFTIVELLVVIVVIGILAAITIVSYTGISQKATLASLTSDLSNDSNKIKLYYEDHGTYPVSFNANNCPLDSTSTVDTRYCIGISPNTTYQFVSNDSTNPPSFCLAVRNSTNIYSIANDSTQKADALCLNAGIVTDGLVLDLDAGNSTSYPGSGNNWYDLSGNGNNSTLANGVSYTSSNGGALVFDGTSGYVVTPKVNNFRSMLMLINKSTTNASWHYLVDARPGDSSGYLANSGIGTWSNFYINGSSTTNLWSNFPTGSWFYIYIEADSNYSSTINFMSRYTNNEFLGGDISSITVYNRTLSSSEINQNFNVLRGRYGI